MFPFFATYRSTQYKQLQNGIDTYTCTYTSVSPTACMEVHDIRCKCIIVQCNRVYFLIGAFVLVSGKAGHGQGADTNLDADKDADPAAVIHVMPPATVIDHLLHA